MASRFSMATLKWTNGAAKARERLPEDIRSEYQALYGQVSEVKFHRPAGTPPEKAKAEFAAGLAEVEGRIATLRASKGCVKSIGIRSSRLLKFQLFGVV